MKIGFFCGTDARGTGDRFARLILLGCGAILLAALGACAAGDAVRTSETPAAVRTAQPFDTAIDGLTDALIAKANVPPGTRRPVVIDPLIDRATGYQTAATQSIGLRMQQRIQERWPMLEVRPFTTASLAEQPLVLLGSISGVASAGAIPASTNKPPVYRIWAVVADLRTDKVIDRQMAWVKAEEIDTTPVAFFADSPAWTPDPHAAAYVKTCSSTAGTPIDPAYRRALQTEALVTEAIKLYGDGRYDDALERYRQASTQDEGVQLRVLNGLYLSDLALGRRREAERDFGRVVDYGLDRGRLAVKFVFRPASTSFWPDPAISGPYRMWVRQIARGASASATCLALTGHTSITGDPAVNDRLSLARAEAVRGRIAANRPDMRRRTSAAGLGSREVLIGTGRDDVTDALDRRVEVKPVKDGSCGT